MTLNPSLFLKGNTINIVCVLNHRYYGNNLDSFSDPTALLDLVSGNPSLELFLWHHFLTPVSLAPQSSSFGTIWSCIKSYKTEG